MAVPDAAHLRISEPPYRSLNAAEMGRELSW